MRNNRDCSSLKPSRVTFDLVTKALTQVNDKDGLDRVIQLRHDLIFAECME